MIYSPPHFLIHKSSYNWQQEQPKVGAGQPEMGSWVLILWTQLTPSLLLCVLVFPPKPCSSSVLCLISWILSSRFIFFGNIIPHLQFRTLCLQALNSSILSWRKTLLIAPHFLAMQLLLMTACRPLHWSLSNWTLLFSEHPHFNTAFFSPGTLLALAILLSFCSSLNPDQRKGRLTHF